jgi:hypothetical protein
MKVTKKKINTSKIVAQKKATMKQSPPTKKSWAFISIAVLAIGLVIALVSAQQIQENRSLADTLVTQGVLPAQTAGKMGTATIKNLTAGAMYKVVVSGTYYYRKGVAGWNDVLADAQWSDGHEQKNKTGVYNNRQNKPRFNGQSLNAQDLDTKFNANHTYTYLWKATGTQLILSMPDSKYTDNVGGLNYVLYLVPTNAAGTPIVATMSATLVPGGAATASATPVTGANGNGAATPSATIVPTASIVPTETIVPTLPITPTLYCITTVGVTDCNAQGTPGAAQPTSAVGGNNNNGANPTIAPTQVAADTTTMPTTTTAPCQTAQVKTMAATDQNPIANIWQQLKDFLAKLVGGDPNNNNNNNNNGNMPCPSVTPAS